MNNFDPVPSLKTYLLDNCVNIYLFVMLCVALTCFLLETKESMDFDASRIEEAKADHLLSESKRANDNAKADEGRQWDYLQDYEVPETLFLYMGIDVGECQLFMTPADAIDLGDYEVHTYKGDVRCTSNSEGGHANVLVVSEVLITYDKEAERSKLSWHIKSIFSAEHEANHMYHWRERKNENSIAPKYIRKKR